MNLWPNSEYERRDGQREELFINPAVEIIIPVINGCYREECCMNQIMHDRNRNE